MAGTIAETPRESRRGASVSHKLRLYSIAVLGHMGGKGWGYNEAIYILLFSPVVILSVLWALGEELTHGPLGEGQSPNYYRYWVVFGLFIVAILARGFHIARQGYKDALEMNAREFDQKAERLWRYFRKVYGATIFFSLLILAKATYELLATQDTDALIFVVRGLFCLGSLGYIWVVFKYYTKNPAYKVESFFGIVEVFLWTGFIWATGGAQSRFFYLYFFTLIPTYLHGLDHDEAEAGPRRRIGDKLRQFSTGGGRAPKGSGAPPKGWRAAVERLATWADPVWSRSVLYPFGWLLVLQFFGALACSFLPVSHEHGNVPLGLVFISDWFSFFVNSLPWAFLLFVAYVFVLTERSSLKELRNLIRDKAVAPWTTRLEGMIGELAAAATEIPPYRCAGVLVAIMRPAGRGDGAFEIEKGSQLIDVQGRIDNPKIREAPLHVRRDVLTDAVVPLEPGREPLPGRVCRELSLTPAPDERIKTTYFYYPDERDPGRLSLEDLKPDLAKTFGEDFWQVAKSMCCVRLLMPSVESDQGGASFYVVFFSSDLAGEYDDMTMKVYEALSAQVVGIFLKYDELRTQEIQAVQQKARAEASGKIADLAMTLTHDFKKQADRLYSNFGKGQWMAIIPSQGTKDWENQLAAYLLYRRLGLVDGVARHNTPGSGSKTLFETIKENPGTDRLPVLRAVAQACWLTPLLASRQERDTISTPDKIADKSWADISDKEEGDSFYEWQEIIEAFFPKVGEGFFPSTVDASFVCAKPSQRDAIDIATDLWILVFHEIARNSVKDAVSREIRASKEGDSLLIDWTTYFRGGEREAQASWGTDKEPDFPKEREPSTPGKPRVAGPGWGQYGNYVIVNQLLNQTYQVYWALHPHVGQYSWTTHLRLSPPIIEWGAP